MYYIITLNPSSWVVVLFLLLPLQLPVPTIIYLGSLIYLLSNYFTSSSTPFLDRIHLLQIITEMRKKMYSTLREIAYIANYLKITEGGIEPKKIKDIMLRDGGTGDAKLSEI